MTLLKLSGKWWSEVGLEFVTANNRITHLRYPGSTRPLCGTPEPIHRIAKKKGRTCKTCEKVAMLR